MTEPRKIVLATQNARFHHVAFALRCLQANLAELTPEAVVLEFALKDDPDKVASQILEYQPSIVGLSVYIWNVSALTQVAARLKALAPKLPIVIGGPEVSYEQPSPELCRLADWVIAGEGEQPFLELCRSIARGALPPRGRITGSAAELSKFAFPYSFYSPTDLKLRTTYLETSRGCPFHCEFCLSSLDQRVRFFPLEPLLEQIELLIQRGASHLKFIDRTFNVDSRRAATILSFLLERWRPGMFFHFEVVADYLSTELKSLLKRFPQGALQLEIGVQTFNSAVAERIRRSTNFSRLEENLSWLRTATRAHIHADLIAGLPGEDLQSFASGFDRLFALRPHEIQLGLLKRLKGAAIGRHAEDFRMRFSADPPYEILSTRDLKAEDVLQLKRVARFFDLVWNSGRFPHLAPFLPACLPSPFQTFWALGEKLYSSFGRTHGIDRAELRAAVVNFVVERLPEQASAIAQAAECERQNESKKRKRTNGHCRQERHAANRV